MYVIRKIRMYGFKSFPKETTIELSPGLTGIVGPNGCGKSNITDAILWVMGEQSFKNLRGGAMEDVVFNGSDKLAPMGMAEVELRIENLEPAEGEDRFLTIERKYFREGDGQYRLNGKRVRRKDIQERLLEIGLGSKSYSIIEQGRISTLINARPEERRFMIEEAAGILKYKMKKKEAESKIRLTQENLERVEDIIAEVKRNLNSLRQQAARARQFKTIQDDYRQQKGALLAHRVHEQDVRIRETEKEKGNIQDRFAGLAAARADMESRMEEQKTRILQKEHEVSVLNRDYFDRKLKSERLESEISHSEAKLRELVERLDGYDAVFQQMDQELKTLAESRKSELRNSELVQEDLENLEARRTEMEQRLEQLKTELATRDEAYQDADRQLKEVERSCNATSSEHAFARKQIRELGADIEAKQGILDDIRNQVSGIAERIKSREEQLIELEDRLDDLKRKEDESQKAVGKRKQTIQDRQDRVREIEIEIGSLESHMDSMQRFLDNREGFSDAVKSLMTEHEELIAGVLGDFIETDGKMDTAMESFFSRFYQVLVPRDRTAFEKLLKLTHKRKINGVAILSPDKTPSRTTSSEGLMGHLNWKCPLPENIQSYLGRVEVVKNREEGENKGTSYLTRDGDYFLAETGIYFVGGRDEHGFFSIKTGLRESETRLEEQRSLRNKETAALEKEKARLQKEEDKLAGIRQQREDVRLEMSSIKATLESERGLLVSKEADTERIGEEVREKRARVSELKTGAVELEQKLADLEGKTEDLIHERRERMQSLDKARVDMEYASEEFSDLKILFEKRQSTLQSIQRELEFLERREAEIRENLEQTKRNRELDKENRNVLEKHIARTREQADTVVDEYRSIDAVLTEKKQELDGQRRELLALEQKLTGHRRDESSVRDLEQQMDLKLVELRSERNHIVIQLKELFEDEIPPDPQPVEDDEALQIEVEKLERKVHAFGAVNLLAIEECREHEERFEFLKEQRKDLVASISNLTRDIREIDKTTRDLFMKAYDAISGTFEEVFSQLFGGGSGRLTLTEPDDPLETGVEIFAQPPGKKIQSITLMSGGEKALTALALLFAMFEYRISPMCVLDEVDAPLDEANVIQLGQFVRRYRDRVQFVIVTHNKTTMEMVDYLYGVTMEEPGCSKIVSVRLDERASS